MNNQVPRFADYLDITGLSQLQQSVTSLPKKHNVSKLIGGKNMLENPLVSAVLAIFLIAYTSMYRPKLSPSIEKLFKNKLFIGVFLFMLIYTRPLFLRNMGKKPLQPIVIILGVIVFLYILETINYNELKQESYYSIKNKEEED